MALNKVRMLCSDMSHMPLHTIFKHAGVTQKHGFELEVDIANREINGSIIKMSERAPALLAGKYEFLSGLHHETYVYRAKGDRRFVYLAQPKTTGTIVSSRVPRSRLQNSWKAREFSR